MPTTITALLIILIAILPGLLGNKIYKAMIGTDWREKDLQLIIRLSGFSILGLTLYSILCEVFALPPPVHLLPDTYLSLKYSDIISNKRNMNDIFMPYIGHLIGGAFAGVLGAWGVKILGRVSSSSAYPGAWDVFSRKYVSDRWVFIGLKNGEVYSGKVSSINVSAGAKDRDIVLREPCLYNGNSNKYISLSYQYIFIPADNIYSIASLGKKDVDSRTIPVGASLFP